MKSSQTATKKKLVHTNLAPGLLIVRVKSTSSVQALISSCPGSCVEYSDPIRTILASKEAGKKKKKKNWSQERHTGRRPAEGVAQGSGQLRREAGA